MFSDGLEQISIADGTETATLKYIVLFQPQEHQMDLMMKIRKQLAVLVAFRYMTLHEYREKSSLLKAMQ
jgi:DMSO/TMAO reductase YedYZ heme-binding membrane subunit